jgi:hypothetical protein
LGLCAVEPSRPARADRRLGATAILSPIEGIAGLDPADLQALKELRLPGVAIRVRGGRLRHRTKGPQQPQDGITATAAIASTALGS